MHRNILIRGTPSVHDDSISEATMRSWEPNFFNVKFGKRETFEVYRGFLIVRHTVQFTGRKPERHTVVYGWFIDLEKGKPGSLCWGHADNAAQARRIIDRILESGQWKDDQ